MADLVPAVKILEPEAVQIYGDDPNVSYVGRIWEHDGQTTTLQELAEAGYSAALVRFARGEKAILLPNFRGGVGIQIKIHDKMIDRILDLEVMTLPLGPGEKINTTAISDFDGDTSNGKAGAFASIAMSAIYGLGGKTYEDLGYRHDDFMEDFHVTDDHHLPAPKKSDYTLGA